MVGRGGGYGSMRVIGTASLCARRGAPLYRCWPPASPSPRAALLLGFTCFSPPLPLLSGSSLLTRALHVPPAQLCATPSSPPCALSFCLRISPLLTTSRVPYPPSLRGASFASFCLYNTVRFLYLPCPVTRVFHSCVSPMPYSDVPTLSPGVGSYPYPVYSEVLLIQDLGGVAQDCGVIVNQRRGPWGWFAPFTLSSTLHLLARSTSSSATSAWCAPPRCWCPQFR